MKKLFTALMLLLVTITLVSCGEKNFDVTFNAHNGTDAKVVVVEKGNRVGEPEDPAHATLTFVGWFDNAEGEGLPFNFTTKIEADTTLHGVWHDGVVVRFNARGDQVVAPVKFNAGDALNVPAPAGNLTKAGFRFVGWFETKRGITWLEPDALTFPLEVAGSQVLHGYWEPLNSATVNWTDDETYRSTITKQARMVLNPLTYENSLENDLIANMATSLYSTEVDWDLAVSQGVAEFPGDFSKIIAGEYSIEALDYHYILVGAARFPLNAEGDELLDENGKYDRDAANTITSREWTYHIRDDIFFQDGTQVTAHTYEYTLQQYLDKVQNNKRADGYYRTEVDKNGYPIAMAFEYLTQTVPKLDGEGNVMREQLPVMEKVDVPRVDGEGNPVLDDDGEQIIDKVDQQKKDENGELVFEDGNIIYEEAEVTWEQVGFKVIDDFTFKIVLHEPLQQSAAVGFGNLRLVHPQKYGDSLTEGGNTNYGTPNNPYMSYGPYVLKAWDEGQKFIFNKNFDYVGKGTINYKSMVYELVETPSQTLNLFKAGKIDVIGLNAENAAEFAEEDNIYQSFTGYPMFLTVNTAPSRAENNPHRPDTIMYDVRFRQALMFGFDRVDYNENYDIPNIPSLVPIPGDIKNYVQDTEFFVESPEYLQVLQDLGIDPESNGFLPSRALQLFDEAYADWIANGNEGPATVKLIARDSTIQKLLSSRVKAMYEAFFEDPDTGAKRLVIDVHNLTSEQNTTTSAAWDFDLTLGGIGFGGSTGAYWQAGAIPLIGALVGGASLGLSHPFTTLVDENFNPILDENGEYQRVSDVYATEVIEIDLTVTWDYLNSMGGLAYLEAEELENTIVFYNWLAEEVDENGVVTKPAGILRQSAVDIADQLMGLDTPWDGAASEPFPGAGGDANKIAAAMMAVFYDHVTHIPTGTSANAALYADKVTVEWPAYSSAFGWGAARYRHLNTDPDFR